MVGWWIRIGECDHCETMAFGERTRVQVVQPTAHDRVRSDNRRVEVNNYIDNFVLNVHGNVNVYGVAEQVSCFAFELDSLLDLGNRDWPEWRHQLRAEIHAAVTSTRE